MMIRPNISSPKLNESISEIYAKQADIHKSHQPLRLSRGNISEHNRMSMLLLFIECIYHWNCERSLNVIKLLVAVLERIPSQLPHANSHPRIDDRMQFARKSFSSFAFNCNQIDEWMPHIMIMMMRRKMKWLW